MTTSDAAGGLRRKFSRFASRTERLAAAFLCIAFLSAGVKIARHPSAADFAPTTGLAQDVASGADLGAFAAEKTQPPSSSSPPSQLSPDGRFRFDADFVSSVPGRAVHAASLIELKEGGLRAVWFSGSREGAADVAIQSAVMNPATLRWSEESTLFDRQKIQQGLWRYVKKIGNPVIARAPDGSLLLWMVNVSLGGWAGSAITWARSVDDGASWSPARRLVTSPFLNISTLVKGAPVFYQNGDIGLPVYHEFISKFAEIIRLSPEGKVLDKTRIPASQSSLQPVLLVADRTHAQAYMRSGHATALMMSATNDAGKTWSATHAAAWPNPDSALAGVVTQTAQQWLALNPSSTNRETLALLKSPLGGSFDGVTPWLVQAPSSPQARLSIGDYERVLGDELKARGATPELAQAYIASAKRQLCGAATCSQEFSYPYLLQSRDGYLHLIYTWHRSRIKHVRFDGLQTSPLDAALPAALNHAATD